MKKSLIILLVIAVVIVVYLKMTSSSTAVVLTEQNGSGESGKARLEEIDGKVRVTLTVSDQPSGSIQPAHIHLGSCPTPGAVEHQLTSVQNDSSVSLLDTTLDELKAKLPLAINIHKSTTEMGAYVSCGDIKF